MTKPDATVIMHRELTLADGIAPEWIHILPLGPDVEGRDGRRFRIDDAQAIVNAFDRDIVIDEDHESESWNGSTAASGWVKELRVVVAAEEARDRPGIWGRVDWTPEGAERVRGQTFRFLSPAFFRWFDDDGVQHVAKLSSVALTNRPNLDLKSLNRAGADASKEPAEIAQSMKPEQLAAIRAALGLAADTSSDAVFVALNSRLAAPVAPTVLPPNPDLVPKADLQLALNRADAAEKALALHAKERHEAQVSALIAKAVEDGKVAPASQDHYRALCSTEAGIATITALFASLPSITAPAPKSPVLEAPSGKRASLNAAEKAHCAKHNLDEGLYLAAINEER